MIEAARYYQYAREGRKDAVSSKNKEDGHNPRGSRGVATWVLIQAFVLYFKKVSKKKNLYNPLPILM